MPYTNAVNKLLSIENIRYRAVYSDIYTEKDDLTLEDAHIHNCYEFYINVSGDVSFLVGHTLYPIQAGDVLITKPGDVHHCILNRSCVHGHFCLWLHADGELEQLLLQTAPPQLFSLQAEKREMLLEALAVLTSEENDLAKTAAFLKAMELILQERRPRELVSVELPEALQNILNYIDENFSKISHINEILPRFYISRATLNRWFRRYIHLSPHDFLEAKKLAYARRLLDQDLSITAIGERSGFSDCSHFIATFKKKFGQSPAQYRKRNTSQ